MGQKLDNLQALRGVACLMVVLFHLHYTDARYGAHTPGVQAFRWFGFAGVDLFFVVSGFIITFTNRRNMGRPAAVPGYLVRRLWRIYPTYWAALAFCVAVTTGLSGFPPVWRVPAETWAWWAALAPNGPGNMVLGHAWTLTYEVLFYVAFGVLMLLPPRVAAVGLGAWGAATVAALFGPAADPAVWWSPVSPFVLEFLAGCLVAHLAARGVTGGRWVAAGFAAAWAVVGVAVVAAGDEPYLTVMARHRERVLVWGVPAALAVYAAVAAEARSARRPPRWLLAVGDASYSIYLLHFQVIVAAVVLGAKVPHTGLPQLAWCAATVLGCVGVGIAFYRAVERPLLTLAKRRPKPVSPSPETADPPARVAA